MNLQKAKGILELNLKEAGKSMPPDVYQALALGIESITVIEAIRCRAVFNIFEPLPGETKD